MVITYRPYYGFYPGLYSEVFDNGDEIGADAIPITVEIDGVIRKRYDLLVEGIFKQDAGPMGLLDAKALLLDGYYQAFDLYRGINPGDPLKYVSVKEQHKSIYAVLYKQSLDDYRRNNLNEFGYTFEKYMEITMIEKSVLLDLARAAKEPLDAEAKELKKLLEE